MIELIQLDDLTCPKIFCDSCGEEITDAKGAAIVFANFETAGERATAEYVHKDFVKGDCMTRAEERIRSKGKHSGWVELADHLAYLVINVGMTAEDIERALK